MDSQILIRLSHPLISVVLTDPGSDISAPAQAVAASSIEDAATQAQILQQQQQSKPLGTPGDDNAAGATDRTQERIAEQELSQARQILERIAEAIDELEARRSNSLEEMQRAAVELAVAVGEHLARAALEKDEYAVEDLVSEAIEKLGPGGPIRVHLHPDDLALLSRRLSARPEWCGNDPRVELVSDPSLDRGDCVAECGETIMASKLDLRIEELRQTLLGALPHAQIERRRTEEADKKLRRFPERRQTA